MVQAVEHHGEVRFVLTCGESHLNAWHRGSMAKHLAKRQSGRHLLPRFVENWEAGVIQVSIERDFQRGE
jgi:hypothetical protein